MFAPTVFEFRNYKLRKGGFARFAALFEAQFIEPQEVLGSLVIGTFRCLDDPDRFVWMRGFETLESRATALDAFYTSAHWRAHRSAANADIRDSDNVFQLKRPVNAGPLDCVKRAPLGAFSEPRTWYRAVTHFVAADALGAFALAHARAEPGAIGFVTDPRPNPYPRLPVRDESVFLSLTRHSAPPSDFTIPSALATLTTAPPHVLRLESTARSLLQ